MSIKEELLHKLNDWLNIKGLSYDEDIGLKCEGPNSEELRDGQIKNVYVIGFKTVDNIQYDDKGEISEFVEGMFCFAYYDSELLDLIYILTNSGYIETNNEF